MTETVRAPCVRGCTRPIKDPQSGERIGVQPRDATEGLLCPKCAQQLRDWATEIIELFAMLNPRPGSTGAPFAPGKRQKISGSPALARLDVVVLQDWRTGTKTRPTEDQPNGAHEPGDETAQPASIPEQYIELATDIAKQLQLKTRPDTLTAAISFITGPWFTNICYLNWIDDLYQTVKDTRRLLRRTNNLRDPKPLGKCGCGQTLYEPDPIRDTPTTNPDRIILECRNCGHKLNAIAITRLAAAQRFTGTTA
jgi:hypothetical protein